MKQRSRFKPKVLFVDDDYAVRAAGKRIANELKIRAITAEAPSHAKPILAKRIKAIKRLKERFIKSERKQAGAVQKAQLRRKINNLTKMQKAPYPLIVSDINMPRYHPTGVKLVSEIRKMHPKQKIILYSDDKENAQQIQKAHTDKKGETIPWVNKQSFESEEELAEWIKEKLKLKNKRNKR